ncbi:Uncharacterised protein [Vibrio cholerae]|nr:Uncharacterised protein [Vibrio cholerae]CSD27039.1 Uncharacterised protein [Vibrio cholerae]
MALPCSSVRITMLALRPQWQMVFSSISLSAHESRYLLPSNSSPRKSVRKP